jgi:hypothetical protein
MDTLERKKALEGLVIAPKPLIYIAGPYTLPDPVLNLHRALEVAEEVEHIGGAVLVPHLSMIWHIVSPDEEIVWYERDLQQMARCDAVVRFPGDSVGADKEVKEAERMGLPIFYYDWLEAAEWTDGRSFAPSWVALRKWIKGWPGNMVTL